MKHSKQRKCKIVLKEEYIEEDNNKGTRDKWVNYYEPSQV